MPNDNKTLLFLNSSDSTTEILHELNFIVNVEGNLLDLIVHIEEKEVDKVMDYYNLHQDAIDLSQADNKGNLPIHHAALQGLHGSHVLKTLSNQTKLINSKNNKKMTPLHLAASSGHIPTVVELLNLGAEVFDLDEDYHQAYYYAIKNGHQEIVDLIREKINAVTKQKDIIKAAKEFDYKKLESLLHEHVVLTSSLSDTSHSTALHYLARSDKVDLLSQLIKNHDGNFLNAQNREGDTALHMAGRYGQTEVFTYLLKSGSDLTIRNLQDLTALDMAIIHGHFPIVQLYSNKMELSPDIIQSMLTEAVNAFYPLRTNATLNKFNTSLERNAGIFKNLNFLLNEKNIPWITPDEEGNNSLHHVICKADSFADAKPVLKSAAG